MMTATAIIKPSKKDREAVQVGKLALAALGVVVDGKVAKYAAQLDDEAALCESGPAAPPAKEPPEWTALYNTGSDHSLQLIDIGDRLEAEAGIKIDELAEWRAVLAAMPLASKIARRVLPMQPATIASELLFNRVKSISADGTFAPGNLE
jgi:hypothetical protein